jgi:hypothetical protein
MQDLSGTAEALGRLCEIQAVLAGTDVSAILDEGQRSYGGVAPGT